MIIDEDDNDDMSVPMPAPLCRGCLNGPHGDERRGRPTGWCPTTSLRYHATAAFERHSPDGGRWRPRRAFSWVARYAVPTYRAMAKATAGR